MYEQHSTRLWLMRHGCTELSRNYMACGDPAIPARLDEEGRAQATAARQFLDGLAIDRCAVSEFPRTLQTAQIVLETQNVPITIDARLNEIDYGIFNGGPFLEYADWLRRNGRSVPPPAARESQADALMRMFMAVLDYFGSPDSTLLVAHGLLTSAVLHLRTQHSIDSCFLPQAPYARPLEIRETDATLIERCLADG